MIEIKRLTPDQVEIGMLLAQDVCNPNGSCLLSQGMRLSAATIMALKQREIDYVLITLEAMLTPEQIAVLEANTRDRLAHLFRAAGADPLMLQLHDMVLQYRLAALNKSNASSVVAGE